MVVVVVDVSRRTGDVPHPEVGDLALEVEIVARSALADDQVVGGIDGALGEGVVGADPSIVGAVQVSLHDALGAGLVDDQGDVVPAGVQVGDVDGLSSTLNSRAGAHVEEAIGAVGGLEDGVPGIDGRVVALVDEQLEFGAAIVEEPGLHRKAAGPDVETGGIGDAHGIVRAVELQRALGQRDAQRLGRIVNRIDGDGEGPRRRRTAVVDGDGEAVGAGEIGVGRVGEPAVRGDGQDSAVWLAAFRRRERQGIELQVLGDGDTEERRILGGGK